VRGLIQSTKDHLQHFLCLPQYLIIPKSQHPIPLSLEEGRAFFIMPLLFKMLPAIGLDHQSFFQAHEIHDIGRNGMLAPEFRPAHLPVAQSLPEALLGIAAPIA